MFEEEDGSDEDLEEEKEDDGLNRKNLANLKEYIPQSILDFIIE